MNQLALANYLRDCKHSETLRVNQLSHSLIQKNQTIYKMGFGQSPFPVPEVVCEALSQARFRKEYSDVQGNLRLRQAICLFHQLFERKNWNEEQIIVGSGSKILLFCLFSAFAKAEVLLPAPSWVSYEPQARLAGHQVHWLVTSFKEKWRVTAEQVETFCLQRANPEIPLILVLNYPSNPTGQNYSREELEQLTTVLRKHNVLVIADEIYSLLSFKTPCRSLQEFYPEGCIVTSGISKWCGAGGWRLGFCHIPEALGKAFKAAVLGVASETYSCAPTPIQVAAITAYERADLVQPFLRKQIALLQQVSEWCSTKLKQTGIQLYASQGGFYLFLDFENFRESLSQIGISSSNQLTEAILMNTGVALLPGSAFGMPSESLTTRLAFVDFEGEQVLDAEYSDAQYSDAQYSDFDFQHMKDGVELICQWLQP